MPEPYADRRDAGGLLAGQLAPDPSALVLGLARGGVPVAAQVAAAIGALLDVLVVRKLGVPDQPEFAMGAIAGVGDQVEIVRNTAVLDRLPIDAAAFDAVYQRELIELRRREQAYRQGRPATPIRDRAVILVDDGLATGSTMRAAIAAVRRQQPARIIVAVPVGARDTCAELRPEVDDLVCPWTPEPFYAVGQAYRDFTPTSEDEVRHALANGRTDQPSESDGGPP